jgi:hypothetical protein
MLGMGGLGMEELLDLLPFVLGEVGIDGKQCLQRSCGRVPVPELPVEQISAALTIEDAHTIGRRHTTA